MTKKPKIGVLYLLMESNTTYWIAVNYNVIEECGIFEYTKLIHFINYHKLDEYLTMGLVVYKPKRIKQSL